MSTIGRVLITCMEPMCKNLMTNRPHSTVRHVARRPLAIVAQQSNFNINAVIDMVNTRRSMVMPHLQRYRWSRFTALRTAQRELQNSSGQHYKQPVVIRDLLFLQPCLSVLHSSDHMRRYEPAVEATRHAATDPQTDCVVHFNLGLAQGRDTPLLGRICWCTQDKSNTPPRSNSCFGGRTGGKCASKDTLKSTVLLQHPSRHLLRAIPAQFTHARVRRLARPPPSAPALLAGDDCVRLRLLLLPLHDLQRRHPHPHAARCPVQLRRLPERRVERHVVGVHRYRGTSHKIGDLPLGDSYEENLLPGDIVCRELAVRDLAAFPRDAPALEAAHAAAAEDGVDEGVEVEGEGEAEEHAADLWGGVGGRVGAGGVSMMVVGR